MREQHCIMFTLASGNKCQVTAVYPVLEFWITVLKHRADIRGGCLHDETGDKDTGTQLVQLLLA